MKTIKNIIVAAAGPRGTDGANTGYPRNGRRRGLLRGLLAIPLIAAFGSLGEANCINAKSGE